MDGPPLLAGGGFEELTWTHPRVRLPSSALLTMKENDSRIITYLHRDAWSNVGWLVGCWLVGLTTHFARTHDHHINTHSTHVQQTRCLLEGREYVCVGYGLLFP